MFPQTKIIEEDLPAQRFLWREMDRKRAPDEYVMSRMIFGSVSSPCSAQYVKNRNAQDFSQEFPDAVHAIITQHYMDDYYDSAETEAEAVTKIQSVIHVHYRGGYKIRNWSSSSKEVLGEIPAELRCTGDKVLNSEFDLPNERVLGMSWNPTN
ncbi:unnamed protein product, partial [Allacma fusca]